MIEKRLTTKFNHWFQDGSYVSVSVMCISLSFCLFLVYVYFLFKTERGCCDRSVTGLRSIGSCLRCVSVMSVCVHGVI